MSNNTYSKPFSEMTQRELFELRWNRETISLRLGGGIVEVVGLNSKIMWPSLVWDWTGCPSDSKTIEVVANDKDLRTLRDTCRYYANVRKPGKPAWHRRSAKAAGNALHNRLVEVQAEREAEFQEAQAKEQA